jgi:hypothetical protein
MRWIWISAALAIVGCSGDKKVEFKDIPPVVVNCHSAQSAQCISQNVGHKVYVGLKSGPTDCASHLLTQGSQALTQIFEVTGSVTVGAQGPILVGTITAWLNFGNVRVYDMSAGRYVACAFIDINDDGKWQATEPIGEGEVDVGGEEALIDGWS